MNKPLKIAIARAGEGKKLAYYPGCSLSSAGRPYDMSLKAVLKHLGIPFAEMKDWTCCGSFAAAAQDPLLAGVLPLSNLRLAAFDGCSDILIPCPECYSRFRKSLEDYSENGNLSRKMDDVLESHSPAAKPVHPLEIFSGFSPGEIKRDLSKIKAVCYYGCLLVRPPEISGVDDCENPRKMELILRACGMQTADWECRTDCCGGSLSISSPETEERLSETIIDSALEAGADCIVTACQMCQMNLEVCRKNRKKNLPVLYFTQIMGLAMGLKPSILGFGSNLVDAENLLKKVE